MKRKRGTEPEDDMLPEYDLSKGVRGKYAKRLAKSPRVVLLDPEVAREFPDSLSVNNALRAISGIIKNHRVKSPRRAAPKKTT